MCAQNTIRICITRISNKTFIIFYCFTFFFAGIFFFHSPIRVVALFINVAFIFTLIHLYRCEVYNLYFHDYRDETWITQQINAANCFFFLYNICIFNHKAIWKYSIAENQHWKQKKNFYNTQRENKVNVMIMKN